jgi:hypothetical protein
MMRLAMVEERAKVARFLAAVGEATEVPPRSPWLMCLGQTGV